MATSTTCGIATVPKISDACHRASDPPQANDCPQYLPEELWTLILSHIPPAQLWHTFRMVSHAFHMNSNFILRNHFAKVISLGHSQTYLSFSHFADCEGTDTACFKPSIMSPVWAYRHAILSHTRVQNGTPSRIPGICTPLLILQWVPRSGILRISPERPSYVIEPAPKEDHEVHAYVACWVKQNADIVGFVRKDGCIGLDWRKFCANWFCKRKWINRKLHQGKEPMSYGTQSRGLWLTGVEELKTLAVRLVRAVRAKLR
jgi:hypothetical protein